MILSWRTQNDELAGLWRRSLSGRGRLAEFDSGCCHKVPQKGGFNISVSQARRREVKQDRVLPRSLSLGGRPSSLWVLMGSSLCVSVS